MMHDAPEHITVVKLSLSMRCHVAGRPNGGSSLGAAIDVGWVALIVLTVGVVSPVLVRVARMRVRALLASTRG